MTILDNGYILDGMNTFECEIKRLIDLFVILSCVLGREEFKVYRLKRWLKKYDM